MDAITHRIHGAAIYGNMDPINIPQMLAYISYMDPMGKYTVVDVLKELSLEHNDSRISDFDNSGSWATSDSSRGYRIDTLQFNVANQPPTLR